MSTDSHAGSSSLPPQVPKEADKDKAEPAPRLEALERLNGRTSPFERYQLEGEIARGGMGAILRVWDEDLRRHLAMKVVLDEGEAAASGQELSIEPRKLARLLEEAQVTGQLDHPGIVPVHELGFDSRGRLYFTMKLVKGKTLKEVFEELARGEGDWSHGPLPARPPGRSAGSPRSPPEKDGGRAVVHGRGSPGLPARGGGAPRRMTGKRTGRRLFA